MTETAPKKSPGLLRSSFFIGLMTLLSRVLGLARDIAFAVFIGASGAADPFFIAFKIPNFLRRLFAEGAFAQAFVPILSEYRQQRGFDAVRALVDRVSGVLGLSLIGVSTLAVVAAPAITALFAPGYLGDAAKFALTTDLIRITFPYLFLISMTGFSGAILNCYGRFGAPAFAPVLLNVVQIGAAFASAHLLLREPTYALAWGVLLAGIAQWMFQWPFLRRIDLLPRPRWEPRDEGVQRILKLMLPALFGVSISQINLLLGTVIASFLPTGSVSWMYYADRLTELPLGIFGVAIGTVILPSLSRDQAADARDNFSRTLDWALRLILVIATPAAVALWAIGHSILTTLFLYRKTTPQDISMSAYALAAVAFGLTAFMLIKVLAPGYYARQDMKTPVRVGMISIATNMVLSLALAYPFHVFWHLGHAGLALATSLAAWVNAGLLARGLLKAEVFRPEPGWARFGAQLAFAIAAMALVLVLGDPDAARWQAWPWYRRVAVLAALCGAGLAVYAGALWAGGMRPRQLRSPARA